MALPTWRNPMRAFNCPTVGVAPPFDPPSFFFGPGGGGYGTPQFVGNMGPPVRGGYGYPVPPPNGGTVPPRTGGSPCFQIKEIVEKKSEI